MFFSVPALAKVLLIFTLVLVLNRTGLHLGLALIIGALGLCLWFDHGIIHSLEIVVRGAINIECFFLLLLIYQILTLTLLMNHTGMMKKMIRNVQSIVPSRRMALAVLPAMIGLLPMPGGAAVSAPMVDAADEDRKITPLQKTTINYWFRHSWEYWWPLYPGVLLASEISGLSLKHIAIIQMPLTLFSILFGSLFLLLPLKLGPRKGRPKGRIWDLFQSLLPIIILLIIWRIAGWLQVYLPDNKTGHVLNTVFSSRYLPLIIGLTGAIIWIQMIHKPDQKTWKDILTRRKSYLLLVVVIGVKIFSAALESELPQSAGGERIVDLVRENLEVLHVPKIIVVMIIPFISGIVTGLAYGFVGASFPIVMSLVGESATITHVMSYVVLAYGFGYVGMMLSPVHVCFVVTNEYFKTQMLQTYRKLIGPSVGVLIGALLMSFLALRLASFIQP
jgi:hypothetical protein